jgi:hypothetical protein
MSDNRSELGLNNRHRDVDGRIDRKHGNTLVRTLRDTYGNHFAAGTRGDPKLSTLLERANSRSLSNYLKR